VWRRLYVAMILEKIHRFCTAKDGNIAVTFALALVPLMGFVGAAVDISQAVSARSSMQAALDSASLMVSKDLSQGTITTSQISTTAQKYFNALYTNTLAQSVSVTASYTAASGTSAATVLVSGSGTVPSAFLKVLDIQP